MVTIGQKEKVINWYCQEHYCNDSCVMCRRFKDNFNPYKRRPKYRESVDMFYDAICADFSMNQEEVYKMFKEKTKEPKMDE